MLPGLFIFNIASTSPSFAQDKTDTKKESRQTISKRTTDWAPIPFDGNLSKLPTNFKGTDPVKFLQLVESRLSRLEKGQFEKSEDYLLRTSNLNELFSPIDLNATYSFSIDDLQGSYNVDTELYTIEKLDFSCKDINFKHNDIDLISCKLANIKNDLSRYQGSNSYGAITLVKKTRQLDLHLAIKRDNPLFQIAYTRPFKDSFHLGVNEAKKMNSSDLSVLVVGKLKELKLIDGEVKIYTPTYSSPHDIHIANKSLYFEVTGLVYYKKRSGEILVKKFF